MSTNTPIELTAGNLKDATEGMQVARTMYNVPFDQLNLLEDFNVRVHDDAYEAHIEWITGSVLANGYNRDEPMQGFIALGEDGVSRIYVTDGHSRYEAVRRAIERGAKIETIPVITKPRGTTMEDLTVSLYTSNTGRPLTPFELGTVVKRLVGFGWDEKRISQKLNITTQYVSDLLTLQEAPKAVRDMVAKGEISPTMAISTVKKHSTEATKVLKDAVTTAKAQGKSKASNKHVAKDWKGECRRHGTDLYEALMWAKEDAGFVKLTPETQEVINKIIELLPPEPEKKAPVAKKEKTATDKAIDKATAKAAKNAKGAK